MITSYTISNIMSHMKNKAIASIKKENFVDPMLIIIDDKKQNFNTLFGTFENVINIEYINWFNGLYISIFHLYIRDKKDDDLRVKLSNGIASHYSPLAMGFIAQGMCKPISYTDYHNLGEMDLNLDPDCKRLLLTRFYMKGNTDAFIQKNTFLVMEQPAPLKKYDFGFPNPPVRSVSILASPWEINPETFLAQNEINPYT